MINFILFLYRLLKQLVILFCIIFPLQILGALILPVALLLVGQSNLPRFLRWFDNADIYIGRDSSVYESVKSSGLWNRYVWLAFRNPLNYFGYKVLGVQVKTAIEAIYETMSALNVGDTTETGFYYAEAIIDGSRYYEYYWVISYPLLPTYCFRFRMGHKLKKLQDNKIGDYIQFVMVISPFHSYSGK